MPSCHLTRSLVQSAQPTGRGWSTYWDSALRGFGLRVRPSGRRTWVVAYRTLEGRKGYATLGQYPQLPLKEARRLGLQLLAEVARGGHPAAERRRARRAHSFNDLAASYLERRSRPHKRTWREDERRIAKYLGPELGAKRASEITRSEVAALHREIGSRSHPEANRVIDLLGAIYSWGEREELLPEAYPNPARGIRRFPSVERNRSLSRHELRRIAAAIESEPTEQLRGFFWILLLCGMRKGELLPLQWPDVDLDGAFVRLRRATAETIDLLPLSRPALAILEALPRRSGCPFVFPSSGARGGHVSKRTVERAWRRVVTSSGVRDVRIHDLRRTVGSWLAASGASLDLLGSVLGYRSSRATRRYGPLTHQARRAALEQHGAAVLAATMPAPPNITADARSVQRTKPLQDGGRRKFPPTRI